MKKLLAILFLTVYVFSATEFNQLLKLPLLVEHYIEHKEENKLITFLEFLHMHYSTAHAKDADYNKDMKLPFKSPSNTIAFNALNCLQANFETELNYPVQNSKAFYFIYSEHIPNAALLNSIWQPPKQA